MSQVTKQKGAASSTPSAFRRWALSRYISHVIGQGALEKARAKAEAARRKDGRRHLVEYFHQIDDGYSHLAVQVLAPLLSRYDVDLVVHLVPATRDANAPEPDLLQRMSRADAVAMAGYYGLGFPEVEALPTPMLTTLAGSILCRMDAGLFAREGGRVSEALWRGDEPALRRMAEEFGAAPAGEVAARLDAGAARRRAIKHYSGAMFHYEGQWYWGVDRLHHLETRLRGLGAARPRAKPVAPRQEVTSQLPEGAKEMTLEYFPSMRSPYTAVSWEPTMELVRASGVKLAMRPVLPMVMRGVPTTFEKGFYIFKDAAREARAFGVDFGGFHDPIGAPVENASGIWMWATERGAGADFYGAFLRAAFAEGVNTNTRAGMRKVVEAAGLDWAEAEPHMKDKGWRSVYEENRLAMYGFGSWGVPSYRLLDRDGAEVLGVWGQDRLWLVSRKLAEHGR
ncbi:MAG: DsbA family protein [Pseudomonadota bacterium]